MVLIYSSPSCLQRVKYHRWLTTAFYSKEERERLMIYCSLLAFIIHMRKRGIIFFLSSDWLESSLSFSIGVHIGLFQYIQFFLYFFPSSKGDNKEINTPPNKFQTIAILYLNEAGEGGRIETEDHQFRPLFSLHLSYTNKLTTRERPEPKFLIWLCTHNSAP